MINRRLTALLCLFTLLISGLLLSRSLQSPAPSAAQRSPRGGFQVGDDSAETGKQTLSEPVVPFTTVAVRDLPARSFDDEIQLDREINPRINWDTPADVRLPGQIDPLLSRQANSRAATDAGFLTPILNTTGQGFSNVNPPDPSGDVGPNHFVQMINGSGGARLTVYDKDLNVLSGPISLDSLGTGNCASGLGDPIVLYDRLADRWLLTEFSNGGDMLCLYVSQTADPSGAYKLYAFKGANSFPDYPKYGVWPDAYYAGTNESVPTVYAFDRAKMLAGAPATMQSFNIAGLAGFGFEMLQPSDLDGATPPPDGAPNYFMRHRDTEAHGAGTCPGAGSADCLEIFEFHVDWETPANSRISGPTSIPVAEFDSDLCGLSSFNCIEQDGSTTTLDPLREVIMQRLQYRNFGTHETLVGNLVTDVNGNDRAGIRWFELRKSGADPWTLHQEGTYAPGALSRWMGSAAMDQSGNIAVAYNVSSSSTFPSLRYAGRLASDTLGTLPQQEGTIITGSAANGSNRYGDYSQLGVDPADDCTFWYTAQYNASSAWSTRIATFKFSSCGKSVEMSAEPTSVSSCEGESEPATFVLSLSTSTSYSSPITLDTSLGSGTTNFSVNPITSLPATSTLTVSDLAVGTYEFDVLGSGTDLSLRTPLSIAILSAEIDTPVNLLPKSGATNQMTSLTFSWQAVDNAQTYTLELASDPAFNNIIRTVADIETTSHRLEGLQTDQTYYWRVTAHNPCDTATSTPFVFTTGLSMMVCSTPELDIPDNSPTGITDSIVIEEDWQIASVRVSANVTHSYIGDLIITTQHVDTGKTVTLIDRPSTNGTTTCSGNDIDATYDDSATAIAETTCENSPAHGGSLRPNGSLSDFKGDSVSGTWRLFVSDNANVDQGQLIEWCLHFDAAQTETGNDLSDLPGSYGVATHSGSGSFSLGPLWDSDDNALPGQDDDNDDGIDLPLLVAGSTQAAYVTVMGSPTGANGWLQAWIDWDNNGSFGSNELIFNGAAAAGVLAFDITPPIQFDDTVGVSYRFRLFDSESQPAGAPSPTGTTAGGEVTDGVTLGLSHVMLPIVIR